jgi:hypothetical protein
MKLKRGTIKASDALQKICIIYEYVDFRHATDILVTSFPNETLEICDALSTFRISESDIKAPGGNESPIPKKISELLRPLGWREVRLVAKQLVGEIKGEEREVSVETHKIDYVKGRVAFDLEWNAKDQTFDRDLYAFRTFFEFNRISVGILVTRSDELDDYFKNLGEYKDRYGTLREYKAKYGASTTHMGKLRPRLDSGRAGGCPILALGITKAIII